MDIAAQTALNINVIVADRSYPMKVKPEEEEMVRNAAKEVNERIKEFPVSMDRGALNSLREVVSQPLVH